MKRIALLFCAAAAMCGCTTTKPAASCTEAKPQAACTAPSSQAPAVAPLKVGVYADRGPGGIGAVEWFRLVDESPEMELHLLDGAAVRAGALDGLDLLIMPGGSSVEEFKTLGTNGVERMKAFVRNGGGYVGTCAGCCLLMDGPKKRARMMPWNSSGSEGHTMFPTVNLNAKGAKALGLKEGPHVMRYHGGPFLHPTTNVIADAHMEIWGTFDAEATFKGRINPKKQMYGSGAIVGGTYGKGRVFVTSAHPEYFNGTLYIIEAALKYVTGRTITFPPRTRVPRVLSVGFLAKGISGVKTAETAVALARAKDLDLVLIDLDGIARRRMDNIDVLVVPSAVFVKNKKVSEAISAFTARGGKVLYCNLGVKDAPAGAATSTSGAAVAEAVRKLFPTH
ncbi:MAG: hypothetical protein J6V72_00935 [Kiritimatiellae bacterium]|nr:hypothetical protein [Kiritimatiellia bacterium]